MSQTVCSEQLCVLINISMMVQVETQQIASFFNMIYFLILTLNQVFVGERV